MTLWQWVFVFAVGIVGVGLVVWSVSSRGLHRRKWWRRWIFAQPMLDAAEWRSLIETVESPWRSLDEPAPRCSSDDWNADPPTVVLPAVVELDYYERSLALLREKLLEPEPVMPSRHTSPSESLRGRYEIDTPVFWELAKDLGFDAVRGWDSLFAIDGLVTT